MAGEVIKFEGVKYNFPEGTSDDDMLKFLSELPKEETKEPPEPLREQAVIKKDEGVKRNKEGQHVSYKDKNVITGGRGHQLTKAELKLYPKGTPIPDAVVKEWFKVDMEEADTDLTELLEERAVHVPDEVYDILLNMTFNMGKKSMKGFKELWKAVELSDWQEVSKQMLVSADGKGKSQYLKDVGNRAIRLADRMSALAPAKEPAVQEAAPSASNLTPSKGGLFEDDDGNLFMVDEQGNKTEV